MQTVPQKKDEKTINDLSYCCEALIFTHPLVYMVLCGLIFMGHPVSKGSWTLSYMGAFRQT